jgi:hypothetical protein
MVFEEQYLTDIIKVNQRKYEGVLKKMGNINMYTSVMNSHFANFSQTIQVNWLSR